MYLSKSIVKTITILSIILIPCKVFCQDTSLSQGMARINVDTAISAILDAECVFKVQPKQDFIYDFHRELAFNHHGDFGYIPKAYVKQVNRPYFKMSYSYDRLSKHLNMEINESCKQNHISYKAMVDSIVLKKDGNAVITFYKLHGILDGAAAEAFPDIFFKLINTWSDSLLFEFLSKQKTSFLKGFCSFIIDGDFVYLPIDLTLYYKTNYHKSWGVMKKYGDRAR